MHQHYSDDQAEALDMDVPNENPDSDDTTSGSDEAIAQQVTPASSRVLRGPKKESYIRRRKRKLRFYLLPRANVAGIMVEPPNLTMKQKKACLRSYFRKFGIPVDIYQEWFIAV